MPEAPSIAILSDDENLVLSLRLRDGLPNRVPHHRSTGVCKYAKLYAVGSDCEWCEALNAREALEAPAERNPNVVVMPLRFRQSNEDAAPVRRTA